MRAHSFLLARPRVVRMCPRSVNLSGRLNEFARSSPNSPGAFERTLEFAIGCLLAANVLFLSSGLAEVASQLFNLQSKPARIAQPQSLPAPKYVTILLHSKERDVCSEQNHRQREPFAACGSCTAIHGASARRCDPFETSPSLRG